MTEIKYDEKNATRGGRYKIRKINPSLGSDGYHEINLEEFFRVSELTESTSTHQSNGVTLRVSQIDYVESYLNFQGNYHNYVSRVLKSIIPIRNLNLSDIVEDKKITLSYNNKNILILDLDETLIHADFDMVYNHHDHIIHFNYEEESISVPIILRPDLFQFLQNISELFEVYVFTASKREYADAVIDYLDPHRIIFKRRFYRDHCININNKIFIKDLRMFTNCRLNNIIIVDNSLYSFANQLSNGILINSFYNDKQDKGLLSLFNYLQHYMSKSNDIRVMNEKIFNFDFIFEEYMNNPFWTKSKLSLYRLSSFNFTKISRKKNDNIFNYLNERNLIANMSNYDLMNNEVMYQEFIRSNPRMYIGFDPTAESLHLGNLIGILTALRFGVYGIEPILLIGGATGQIGDPSGKNKERPLMEKERINKNIEGIKSNISILLSNIELFPDYRNFCMSRDYINKKTQSSSSDEEEKLIEVKLKKVNQDFNNNPYDLNYDNLIKTFQLAKKSSDRSDILDESFHYKLIDNMEFYRDLNIIDFLKEVGTNLRMGPLLSRDTVKNRLNTKEGLSLTEFMYQTFQGYDYLKLYERYNARIQIGGSDQWGNMLAGYELIKKVKNQEVVNMTFPLMTTANGQKFGKSEGNALFINPHLTPINNIYQYFYNLPDSDLQKLFYAFTFIDKQEIDDILISHSNKPEMRVGQKLLAEKIIGLLYSEDEAVKCRKNAEIHYKNFSNISSCDDFFKDCNMIEISEDCLNNFSVSTLCVEQKILNTKSQCRRLIQSGSVLINNTKISDDVTINKSMLIGGKFLILKTGKKHTHIFQIKTRESEIDLNNKILLNNDVSSI